MDFAHHSGLYLAIVMHTSEPSFKILPGLPPYGDPAKPFPESWGKTGREGFVVQFRRSDGRTWCANFAAGIEQSQAVMQHPDGQRVLVINGGDVWSVDPDQGSAERIFVGVDRYWPVDNPVGLVLSRQQLAFARLGPGGLMWHTRRLSWDGFDKVEISSDVIVGLAWSPLDEKWHPFEVDLRTGRSRGGSFNVPSLDDWERLAAS